MPSNRQPAAFLSSFPARDWHIIPTLPPTLRQVTFVPPSSELFRTAAIYRKVFPGHKCKQQMSKQTGAGRIVSKLYCPCEFEEPTLLARRLKGWRTLSTSRTPEW